jgi:hypothetical protein
VFPGGIGLSIRLLIASMSDSALSDFVIGPAGVRKPMVTSLPLSARVGWRLSTPVSLT